MNYRWTFRNKADESTVQSLVKSLGIPKSLASVLIARGVSTPEGAKSFFEPSLDDLYDPFLMDGMDVAVDRILRAIKEKELIWIHGDYDVDGTASTSMVLQFLREIGGKVDYYIPDRFREGYGLSVNSVQHARKRGSNLVLTVDVGITSYEAINYAKTIDMDIIICDHHEPGDFIPEVYMILDPLKPGCPYPFKNLAACGVAFKLVQGIAKKLDIPEKAYEYLDYVAISSAADMVPLIDENRIMVYYGLKQINIKPRPGLKGLIDCTIKNPRQIDTSSIIYSLAPLINAAGRLGDARRSVEMMIEKDETVAFQIAQKLEQENRRRRIFDEQTFEEAIPIAEKMLSEYPWRSLVLHVPHWHAGVIGIVASRMVDRFHLPTILLTTIDNQVKGSARSIHDFDIHKALKGCSNILTEYGGHKHAAGMTLKPENVEEFRQRIEKIAETQISSDMLVPDIVVDAELKLYELSPQFLYFLNKFAPYGFDNNKPMFFSQGVTSANGIKIFQKNHIKFRAFQSFEIDAIGYNLAEKFEAFSNGRPFSILYNIEENVFNGNSSPQLRIKDIRADEY